MVTDRRIESVKDWLRSKGTTLWADWDISREDRLDQAARWFVEQMDDYWVANIERLGR